MMKNSNEFSGDTMTNHIGVISQRSAGIITGAGFLITLTGVLLASICDVVPGLIVSGDADAKANQIVESGVLYRVGIIGWLVVILGDVVRAWTLYVFFKRVPSVTHQSSCFAQHYRRISTCCLAIIQGRKNIFRGCRHKGCIEEGSSRKFGVYIGANQRFVWISC